MERFDSASSCHSRHVLRLHNSRLVDLSGRGPEREKKSHGLKSVSSSSATGE